MRALAAVLVMAAVTSSCAVAEEAKTVAAQYPYLCSGALRDAVLASLGDGVVARCEGIIVTQKDLDAQIQKLAGSTREQARKYPVYTLQQYLTKQLTLVEARDWAKKNGRAESSDDQLLQDYLAANTPKFEVSDKEAEEFYREHVNMFAGAPYEQVKGAVAYFVRDQKTSEAREDFFVHAGEQEILSDLYGVNTIPVQFLFDKDGKLLLRHQGNLTKEQVLARFAENGVNLSKGNDND